MNSVIDHLPVLKGVHHEELALDEPFEQIAARFADINGTVVLMSGSDLDCARYNVLAAIPVVEIKSFQENVAVVFNGQTFKTSGDPFELLEQMENRYRLSDYQAGMPVEAGMFGYFSYDLKDRIENLPVTCVDAGLPDMCLYIPSVVLVQDIQDDKTIHLFIPLFAGSDDGHMFETDPLKIRETFLEQVLTQLAPKAFSVDASGFKSCFSKSEYVDAIQKIIRYLKAGDIYQANLSQRFEAGFSGDPYALFLDLFKRNPAAFFSFVQAGDHTIVSSSPERFIKVDGKAVETRPIKGTIARGKTQGEDSANAAKLCESIKDDAELTMIVDLMRNDLSRVTEHDSVVVREHKRIEPYDNVFHLVSVVEGTLSNEYTAIDLLKATFPGGSITGCPKIRSMEIIDELEPVKRHVYTGSIGYISFHDTMDLSIAIRTATVQGQKICFSVGGGIVYDSDPEKEYKETLDKGKTLMDALSGQQKNGSTKLKAWVNGKIVDQDKAVVPVTAPGFQYGAGLFETIRVERGRILRLADHLARLEQGCKKVLGKSAPDISWEVIIRQLIAENGFENEICAVKLMVALNDNAPGKSFFLCAMARKYTHRLEALAKEGLDLITYPYPRYSPLADHKTMNYLYYYQAAEYARSQKGDEALILNPDGTVSETNTASLMAVDGNTVWVPESEHALAGVMQKTVLTLLKEKGYDVRKEKLPEKEFLNFPNILATNALMGAVKVLSIDGRKIEHILDVCAEINCELFTEKTA